MELFWASVVCCPGLRAIDVVRSLEWRGMYFLNIIQQIKERVKKEQAFQGR
jgi:hypothetical protein